MKRKLLLNQLMGRWLAVVLALLLMPAGLLAQITMAGTSPNENGNIVNANIQGFYGGSYVAHYSDGVLTLQNVRLEGQDGLIEWSGDTDLTIEFSGTNSINKQSSWADELTPIKSTTGHNLILRAANNSADAKLYVGCTVLQDAVDLTNVEVNLISGFSQVSATGLSTENSSNSSAKDIVYRVPVTSYNLWIGGVQVTSDNASNVLGDDGTPTVVFDAATNTLTLNNLSDESYNANDNPYVVNGLGNLTIHLVGSNFVWFSSLFLAKSGTDGDNYNVTFTTDEENRGSLGLRSGTSDWCTGHTVVYNNGLAWIDQGYDNDYHTYEMLIGVEEYDLTVSGVQVTSANASNVLGDDETPTIVFDAATSTLTLNEANLTVNEGDAIVSGLDNLTIFLVGENYINSYGDETYAFSKSSVSEATITFTTDATSNGSLTIAKLEDHLFGDGVTPVYDKVSIKHDGDYHTISSSCGISVGGVAVTEFNKSNVLGDGKVSYNATTHTLTLNNATIAANDDEAGISFEYDVDLTIALIGNNSIRGGEGCKAIRKIYDTETPHLYFVKADANQHFSLNIIAQDENDLFENFTVSYSEDFFVTDEEDDGTFTMTISSSMFGGTGSADEPFLIKTPNDLKDFAANYNEGRFSNNVHIQLFNDINCEGEEGFTTIADNTDATFYGVFDGNNKTISNLTMTGVGLFGYVSKDNDFGVGTIQDLTLSGYHLTSNDYAGGGIVADLSEGAIVSNCTIVNSTIACAANQYNPEQGGIVGRLSGTSTVTGCVVNNVQVKAETTYTGGSGALGIAGGIVGKAAGGTISSCAVRNGSKITCYYADESAELDAGALVGKNSGTTLSGNYYDYDVTVEMLNGTDTENKIKKSGYTQRAIGGEVQENEPTPDVMDNNGAVMYTQTVTVPGETSQASVTAEQDTYYSTAMISDALAYLVAPGQTVTLNATSGEGYMINTFTATNATTSAAITTTPTELGDGDMQYTFAMPDAPVTVAVTTVAAYGIAVAGIEVTELNYTNVLGDGKVSYNATTHTLTLNNATIVPEDEAVGIYYSGSDNLTISLIGSNSINSGSCSPIRGSETPQLIFAKGDNQPCSLRTENTDGWAIDGFSVKNFGGLFKLESQETEDDETTYYMTLTSTILSGGSGTSADPLIIATANDLKNFASYIRESVIPNTSFAKLSDDIGENGLDCGTLEFEPIGYGSTYFLGTFDGNNKTIKNLTVNDNAGDCVGFVRILGEGGVIKDLTLDNLTLSGGNSSSNSIGGLIGYLNGGTINNCTVQNSNISCKKDSETTSNNSQNPTVGGIAGQAAAGTITNCTLLNSAVNAETFDTWASGANANAGGIVGNVSGGTISGCQVKGTSTVLACYKEFNGSVAAGALFGKYSNGVLSNNTYEYTVTATEKKNVTEQEPSQDLEYQTTSKSGYTQRAIGGEVQENEPTPDVMDNNGAVMYTQTVTLPEETSQASVFGEENIYYSTAMISGALAYLVAPGQTVTLNAMPGEGYVVTGLTATNTTTEATISTNSETLGDNITQYTFTMPDAPVTVALTTAETIGIRVAGVEVTEVNAADVLGDGKVSFTAAVAATETTPAVPATLTLNNATINGCIYLYKDLEGGLTVYLQGQNTIDGGYVSSNENGDRAFATSVQNAKLTITTDKANPGQLLMKNQYRNDNGYAQYYYGNWNRDYQNGLVEGYSSDEKHLIAIGPVVTPASGLYWTDQTYTITGNGNGIIKYSDGMNHFSETTYEDPFTMATVGKYLLSVTQTISCDESSFSLGNGGDVYIVHNKPGFSVEAGTRVGTQNITLSNLPDNLSDDITDYPQVWYYLGDNEQDSIQYTSAEQEIAVTESTKVCVYILDEDSGKVLKSKPVEAEYVILPDIANAVITSLADYVYTGEAIVPEFTVKASADAEGNLTEGTDYKVSYKQGETTVASMIDVGTYTVVITGIGAYGGTKEATFSITQATPIITFAQESYPATLGEEFTSPATVDNWTVTPWASSKEDVATVADGEIRIVGVGTTLITVFYAGDENHLSTTASYQLVVSCALEVAFVGSNLWASYYATENLVVPEGLTAYVVSGANEATGVVTVASIGYIPADNGVLLKREEGSAADGYVAEAYDGATSTFTNLLDGSTSETAVSSFENTPVYVLYNDQFKRATSGTIPGRRAWLALGGAVAPAGAPKYMTLHVVDGESTAIATITTDDNAGDSWYTIDGLKVNGKPQRKGLYIKNGKKVFFNNK